MRPHDGLIEFVGRQVVAARDCATEWGNDGLEVLSTPAILGTMERFCVDAVDHLLEEGEMTVGVSAQLRHRAAVQLGEEVRYRIAIPDAGTKFEVSFEVHDAAGRLISDGTHRRAVIRRADFLARLSSSIR
jgi:fluoroacetyl-CoA thioesterase